MQPSTSAELRRERVSAASSRSTSDGRVDSSNDTESILSRVRSLKHELKHWEAAFQKKHSRMPQNGDLVQRPDIARKYKQYSRLKREAKAKASSIDIPLDTSSLLTPSKRRLEMHPAPTPKTPTPPRDVPEVTNSRYLEHGKEASDGTRTDESDLDDIVEATPKRRRTDGLFPSASKSGERIVQPKDGTISPEHNCARALFTDSSTAGGTSSSAALPTNLPPHPEASDENDVSNDSSWDPVAYVPPPSLLRPYSHTRPNMPAYQPPTPSSGSRTEFSPLTSADKPGALPVQDTSDTRFSKLAGSMRSLDLSFSTPSFKARAGRLVKTTSIPLSAFGAQFRGASQILSSQGHLSDGCDDLDPSYTEDPENISDSEMVVEDTGNKPQSSGQDDSTATRKKATQKRSTRRVKIKPADDKEKALSSSSSAHVTRSNPQNLVSDNFYKLKLKCRKRGAQSAEDRRLALYKRMTRKKEKRAKAPPAAKSEHGGSDTNMHLGIQDNARQEIPGGDDFGSFTTEPLESISEDFVTDESSYSDAEHRHGSSRTSTRLLARRSSSPQRTIAGKSLSAFTVSGGSKHPGVCMLSPTFDRYQTLRNYASNAEGNGVYLDVHKVLGHVWGYEEFRHGQLEAIERILSARSTLLLLATGSGKSLAYQLPALIISSLCSGLTIVVTPLISLMRDQIRFLPKGLQAICMSFDSTNDAVNGDIPSQLMSGQVQLLFVSPERLASQRFQELVTADSMPPIQLAVIDEAHCASEWSHNFRPAFFQVPRVLRTLNVPCVLAMTGTATASLVDSLCSMFGIDKDNDVIRGDVVRDNIKLSVVPVDQIATSQPKSTVREDTLVGILRSPHMASLNSILVYVSTQATADRVAEYLTARSIPAQSYHAGKSATERARIQAAFMHETQKSGASKTSHVEVPIRVLVATVAFGMGLNKSDIRAVVHFNLPRSVEAYVQEVGRAGRDGGPAQGILMLATESTENNTAALPAPCTSYPGHHRSADAVLMRSWAHSDGVDVAAVRRLLHKLLPPSFMRTAIALACRAHAEMLPADSDRWRVSDTVVLGLQALESDTDASQAVIQTLINYIAMREPGMMHVLPNTHRTCAIKFVRNELGRLAESHAFFAELAGYINNQSAQHLSNLHRKGSMTRIPGSTRTGLAVTIDIFEFAKKAAMSPSDVTSELYKWRAKREIMLTWQEPSCVVQVSLDMNKFIKIAKQSNSDFALQPAMADSGCLDDHLADLLASSADEHISKLAESVAQQNENMVRQNIRKIDAVENTMLSAARLLRDVASKDPSACDPSTLDAAKSCQNELIQASIRAYFSASQLERERLVQELVSGIGRIYPSTVVNAIYGELIGKQQQQLTKDQADALKNQVRSRISRFVQQHSTQLTTGRAVARVFHGLSSPSCASSRWMWCSEWGSLVSVDFDLVRQCAQEELLKVHQSLSKVILSNTTFT